MWIFEEALCPQWVPPETQDPKDKRPIFGRAYSDQKYILDRILVWFWIKMAKIQVVEH